MIEFENTAVVITANLSGAALPGLPMVDVAGQPLLARAAANAEKAGLGMVIVATPDHQVAEVMRKNGRDVLMSPMRESSICAMAASVLAMRDKESKFSHVVVLPCTLPTIDALSLRRCLAGLTNANVDGATLAGPADAKSLWRLDAPLDGEREVAWLRGVSQEAGGRAHIPVYAWHRAALDKFAHAKHGPVAHELALALAAGLHIAAVKVDTMPLNVDTAQNLEELRRIMRNQS
ncbi:MAG: NTP transferase domain-containing protein [Aestuariivirga sp.]